MIVVGQGKFAGGETPDASGSILVSAGHGSAEAAYPIVHAAADGPEVGCDLIRNGRPSGPLSTTARNGRARNRRQSRIVRCTANDVWTVRVDRIRYEPVPHDADIVDPDIECVVVG